MKNFSALIALFSLVIGILMWLSGYVLFPGTINLTTWILLAYFIALTTLFHVGLLQASKSNPQAFVRYYMASTTLKLLVHIGVILIYSLFHREEAVGFILTFLVFYVLFTGFEVSVVYKKFAGSKSI